MSLDFDEDTPFLDNRLKKLNNKIKSLKKAIEDSVKARAGNGVAPTEATVKDGTYLVQRPFVLVTKEGEALSETAQKFFDYATSADAASIISAAGAVPVA